MDLVFRKALDKDRNLILDIFEAIIRKGETYVLSEDSPRTELENFWFQSTHHVYYYPI